MSITSDIGRRGEAVAIKWLLEGGYELQHANWRKGRYELDIVAVKGDEIHFVEVKTRIKESLTTPQDAITRGKFNALKRAAEAYIFEYDIDLEPQFDLITIVYDKDRCSLEFTPNAMYCQW